ncbi:MAG: biopolymer transport protein ExbB [Alphaproteobacteria bacterium]|nr:biopolymer transport protein ExbB [Alphaproteobacteria bacterium]
MTEIVRDKAGGCLRHLGAVALWIACLAGAASAQDLPVTGSAELPRDLSPWGMFLSADPLVQAVLLGLVLASVVTWTVWLAKTIELVDARRRTARALKTLAASRRLADAVDALAHTKGPVCAFLEDAVAELEASGDLTGREGIKERIASRLERLEAAHGRRIMRATGVLATIGATAPFVGLFGTVWGIMNSFIGISKSQTTNLAVVAPGIAEALLATAFGLAAAIPAVVIYNTFSRQIVSYRALLGDASAEVLRLASRDLDRLAAEAAASARTQRPPTNPGAAPSQATPSIASSAVSTR